MADKVKFLFENWKSGQNLKHSTATTCVKKNNCGRKSALSCLKIFVEVSNVLWKAVWRRCFSYSGIVVMYCFIPTRNLVTYVIALLIPGHEELRSSGW